MKFIIQEIDGKISIDATLLIELLQNKYQFHTYELIKEITQKDRDKYNSVDSIPVGDLKFVGDWLRIFHSIDHVYPIEVPEVLRLDKFLQRQYSIVKYKYIPKFGRYFIKDADNLKHFSYTGDADGFKGMSVFDNSLELDTDCLYQVSSELDIISEYRVIVVLDEIVSVDFYSGVSASRNNGVPGMLVFLDANWLQSAINVYALKDKDRPLAYTMDIAVLKNGKNAILEVHDFISCGLYSTIYGSEIIQAYILGIEWILQGKNKRLTEWTNISI